MSRWVTSNHSKKWANKVINFVKDSTNLGVVTELVLHAAPSTHLLILSSYWPFPTTNRDDNKLWNKVLRYSKAWRNAISSLFRHLQPNQANTVILTSDLNATWNPSAKGGLQVFKSRLMAKGGPTHVTP